MGCDKSGGDFTDKKGFGNMSRCKIIYTCVDGSCGDVSDDDPCSWLLNSEPVTQGERHCFVDGKPVAVERNFDLERELLK
jgi:hypothetical protein